MFKFARRAVVVASTLAMVSAVVPIATIVFAYLWVLAAIAGIPAWVAWPLELMLVVFTVGSGVEVDEALDDDGGRYAVIAGGLLAVAVGAWLSSRGITSALLVGGIGYVVAGALATQTAVGKVLRVFGSVAPILGAMGLSLLPFTWVLAWYWRPLVWTPVAGLVLVIAGLAAGKLAARTAAADLPRAVLV